MEFRKKMATLLIALFMISIFAVAVSAQSPDGIYIAGDATVELSTEQANSGSYSYKHVATGEFDEASIFFDYGDTLGSIASVSYYSYVSLGESGLLHPYVYLKVDTGSSVFAYVVQWEIQTTAPTGMGGWVPTTFDDQTIIHVAGSGASGLPGEYGQPGVKTLGDLKQEAGWSGYTVTKVFVELGQFTGAETITAYVDDVTINDDFYDFEPSGAVPVSAGVTLRSVSIDVKETDIDFGDILEGEFGSSVVNIENLGTVPAYVTASLADEEPEEFYTDNFKMDYTFSVADWSISSLAINTPKPVYLKLSIPLGTSAGPKTATLVFWAEEAT